jgi:hypothetical protein
LWLWVVLILAVMLASSAVVAASAQAGSFNHYPPDPAVLMKGKTELQKGGVWTYTWHYYQRGWVHSIGDGIYSFPRAELVGAGSTLHIRLNKPQRPERFRIIAYKDVDQSTQEELQGLWFRAPTHGVIG